VSFAIKPLETPFRTPKHVEHLVAEPAFTRAGTTGHWRLNFVLSRAVPPGHRFFLQIHGKRNNGIRWAGIQVEDENAEGYLSLSASPYGPLRPLEVLDNNGLFEFELPPDGLAGGGDKGDASLFHGSQRGGQGNRTKTESDPPYAAGTATCTDLPILHGQEFPQHART
jgi:hypothetical protein